MQVYGYDIGPILEAGKIAVPVLVACGAAFAWFNRVVDHLLNRDFDQWLVSVTSVGDVDPRSGRRLLMLDNLGSPERFDDAVRGRAERASMVAAAKNCSWAVDRRFLLAPPAEQDGIMHVTLNALTKYWAEGLRAKMAGRPVTEHVYHFAVTGSDASHGTKNKFRVIIMTEETMNIILSHPVDQWDYHDPKHETRLETARKMAEAHRSGGTITSNGQKFRILAPIRAYQRVAA